MNFTSTSVGDDWLDMVERIRIGDSATIAGRRALRLLQSYSLADGRELQGAKAVLDAAALTYVAALAQTLMTLLYYVSILGRRRE